MADLAATNVTYTLVNARKKGDSRTHNRVRLAFGDGALTFPAAGIPLTKGKLGCPTTIESLIVVDKGTSGFNFVCDQSAETLIAFQTDQVDDPEEVSTAAPAATTLEVEIIGW